MKIDQVHLPRYPQPFPRNLPPYPLPLLPRLPLRLLRKPLHPGHRQTMFSLGRRRMVGEEVIAGSRRGGNFKSQRNLFLQTRTREARRQSPEWSHCGSRGRGAELRHWVMLALKVRTRCCVGRVNQPYA